MGDHRISLKAEFEMHGHKAKIDQWVNYSENYVDEIAEWLRYQIEIGMDRYMDAQFGIEAAADAEREAAERAEYERLKKKFEQP
jgi:hypothetical protein